jgi:prophage antirepressor-like protein
MSNNFYLDIFNKLLSINEHKIFIVFDKDENIWFHFKNLLTALGYKDAKKAIKRLEIDDKYLKKLDCIRGASQVPHVHPHSNMINNNGLFMVLSMSTKPLAKQFMKKYIDEIMPSITATGKYISNDADIKKIKQLNYKISDLKHNTKILINNQANIIYPKGSAIYIIKQKYDNKNYYKIGHTINLNTRLHTYNTGSVNKIHYNFYTLIEDSKIDSCIKKAMKDKEYIKNKEFYKVALSSIFNFINKCNKEIKTVYCGYCQKKMSFNIACKHKCKLI